MATIPYGWGSGIERGCHCRLLGNEIYLSAAPDVRGTLHSLGEFSHYGEVKIHSVISKEREPL